MHVASIRIRRLTDDGFTHMAEFGAAAVGRDVSVFWKPGVKDDDFIIFEIRAKTTGWMGLGFSPSGAMKGADLIVMWFDDNGKAHISVNLLKISYFLRNCY